MKLIDTIINATKEKVNNKFLGDVHCACCGAKGKPFMFKTLADKTPVCQVCAKKIPEEFKEDVMNGTFEDYKKAVAYHCMAQQLYEPIFKNDAGYGLLEVDSKHLLFRNTADGNLILPLQCVT